MEGWTRAYFIVLKNEIKLLLGSYTEAEVYSIMKYMVSAKKRPLLKELILDISSRNSYDKSKYIRIVSWKEFVLYMLFIGVIVVLTIYVGILIAVVISVIMYIVISTIMSNIVKRKTKGIEPRIKEAAMALARDREFGDQIEQIIKDRMANIIRDEKIKDQVKCEINEYLNQDLEVSPIMKQSIQRMLMEKDMISALEKASIEIIKNENINTEINKHILDVMTSEHISEIFKQNINEVLNDPATRENIDSIIKDSLASENLKPAIKTIISDILNDPEIKNTINGTASNILDDDDFKRKIAVLINKRLPFPFRTKIK